MNIVLAARLQPKTGNHTTGMRVAEHLESAGHVVLPVDVNMPKPSQAKPDSVDAAVGLHAYASASCLKELKVPKVVIFGGTDLNLDLSDKFRSETIDGVVSEAAALVAISQNLLALAEKRWPALSEKMSLIPQAVEVRPSSFSIRAFLGLPDDAKIILLPAGLRPVKDPLYVAEAMSAWHKADRSVYLVICGEERDGEFSSYCKSEFAKLEGIIYAGSIESPDLHASMLQSVAVINTSVAEGNSVALLEAFALGVPVVARQNDGNHELISAAKAGLIFSAPEECVAACRSIAENPDYSHELRERSQRFMQLNHSLAQERLSYLKLIEEIAGH